MPNNGETKTNEASLVLCEGDVLLKKGPWTAAEDAVLIEYVKKHGEGNWNSVQKNSGLFRCGKSCRLRWANHLRPNLKKGSFCPDEERVIIELHAKFGNKWARMASLLPGRTDNEIKNFWNTRIKRRKRAGLSPYPQDLPKQATHFQFRQPFNSPSPVLPIEPSSSHHLKPNYGYPLSLFDPITIPTTTPLFTNHKSTLFSPEPPVHEFKHFRGNAPHMPRLKTHQYGLHQSPIPQNPFKPDDGLVYLGPFFSTKLELPSSQMPKPAVNAAAFGNPNDYNILMPLTCDDSKLLDALLQENQVISGCQDSKIEENFRLDGSIGLAPPYSSFFCESLDTIPLAPASQWDDLNPTHCSVGMKRKKEPEDEFYSMDDELASLLDIIPSNMSIPELGYSDCGETSNGQSSAVTEDDIGLEMQQLISSLPPVSTTTTDHDLSFGAWNNMPGIF